MKKKSLKMNAIYNTLNQGCVIVFQVFTIPYVSRILHTTNYGKVNFCNSILSYFLLLAQLGITNYVIREGAFVREDRNAVERLVREVYTIGFVSTIIAILLYSISVFLWGKLWDNRMILTVLGVQLLLNVFNIEYINNIYEDFKYIAIRNIIIQVLSLVCIIGFVRDEKDYIKYALIISIAASLNYFINFVHCKSKIAIGFTLHPNIRKHIGPIMILFFNALAVSIYVNSDTTILGIIKNDSVVGVYSVSVKIYSVVKRVIQAIIVVAIPRLSNLLTNSQEDEYKVLLKKMHDTIITIVIPMLVGLIFVANNAIVVVFGEEYSSGVRSLQILCLALIFSSLANYYISCVLLPKKKEKIILIATIVSSVVNVGLNIIFIPRLSLNGAAITTLIAEMVVMIMAYLSAGTYRQGLECLSLYLKVFLGCAGIVLMCLVINANQFSLTIDLVLKIVSCSFIYVIIEFIVKNPAFCDLVGKLNVRLK